MKTDLAAKLYGAGYAMVEFKRLATRYEQKLPDCPWQAKVQSQKHKQFRAIGEDRNEDKAILFAFTDALLLEVAQLRLDMARLKADGPHYLPSCQADRVRAGEGDDHDAA